MKLDTDSLAHTKWECKDHIVFAPKYRRQIIYGKIKEDIWKMLRKLCEYKGVEIHEAEACKDHIHMLVSIPPKYSVSQIMGYLKGKSSLMIFEKYANMKYKYVIVSFSINVAHFQLTTICSQLASLPHPTPCVFFDLQKAESYRSPAFLFSSRIISLRDCFSRAFIGDFGSKHISINCSHSGSAYLGLQSYDFPCGSSVLPKM